MKGRNSFKGKRLDGHFRNVPEGAGWPGRILMAKSTGSKGTGDDAAEVFEVRQGNKYVVPRLKETDEGEIRVKITDKSAKETH